MDDFKQRLKTERAELEEKLNRLNDFNESEKVAEIEADQKSFFANPGRGDVHLP